MNCPLPPLAGKFAEVGASEYEQAAVPAWETVNVASPTVMAVLRAAPVFAATVKLTEPLPLPPGFVTVTQSACGTAVHVHPAPAVTLKLPEPPEAGKSEEAGLTANVQTTGGTVPACVNVTESLLELSVDDRIETVPCRSLVDVFAATLTVTLRLPAPVLVAAVRKPPPVVIDHAHESWLAVICSDRVC